MSPPSIADLYSFYEVLCGESPSAEEKKSAYKSILLGTKGGQKEKQLSCQFIARFSKQFDDLKEESFNCLLDVCDDDDSAVRKQAVHDLLQFSKRMPVFIPRVADVLVQMFQTEDASELHVLSISLSHLLHLDPKSTLAGIFNQLLNVNPENPREHVLKFLVDRLKSVPEEKMTSDVEEFIAEQANKVLRDVSEEEFPLLISILSSLKFMSTVPGRQKLVSMITDQALQACPEFNPTDPACVAQIRESGKQAALCVSKNVHAKELYAYLLSKVLPKILSIPASFGTDQLALLRITAELSISHETDLVSFDGDELEKCITAAYNALLYFLPKIPDAAPPVESTQSTQSLDVQQKFSNFDSVKFSELECLLCICCQLGKSKPAFFGSYTVDADRATPAVEAGAVRLRFIRPRLQYLSRLAQEYAQSLAGAVGLNSATEEAKTKVLAPKLATNIQTFVRCFFHNPPLFKHVGALSWSQPVTPQAVAVGMKRTATTVDHGNHVVDKGGKHRREQPRYAPPVGQWSRGSGPPTWKNGGSRRDRGRRW